MQEEKNPKELYLDLLIDKTYETYFEAGNNLGKAFLTYLLLICLSGLLVFGRGFSGDVKIPFLELTLNKNYAALVILILSCGALYWYLSTSVLHKALSRKLRWLMYERYGVFKATNWNIAYPSPHSAFIALNISRLNFATIPLVVVFFFFLLLSTSALPVILAWSIGNSLGLSSIQNTFLCIGVLALVVPSMHMFFSMHSDRIPKLIVALDEKGNEEDKVGIVAEFELQNTETSQKFTRTPNNPSEGDESRDFHLKQD